MRIVGIIRFPIMFNGIIKDNQRIFILIVDDRIIFRNVFRETLRKCNRIGLIKEAENAEQMFNLFAKNRNIPDLVFIDEKLSGMNGFEATRRLLEIHPDLKIVIMTLTDTVESRALAKEAGAMTCLVKKNLVEELGEVIEGIK